jgi:hypothetical protein
VFAAKLCVCSTRLRLSENRDYLFIRESTLFHFDLLLTD